jgi:hypothetical protein
VEAHFFNLEHSHIGTLEINEDRVFPVYEVPIISSIPVETRINDGPPELAFIKVRLFGAVSVFQYGKRAFILYLEKK